MTPPSAIIARVERELHAIGEARGLTTRLLSMNLVVVAESIDIAANYTHVVDEVSASLLARAIVVGLDAGSRQGTLEGCAVHVTAPGGEKDGFTERVSLTARGPMCLRIPSVIESLRVAEVPIALVWLGRLHPNDAIFEELAERAERVLIDSEYTSVGNLVGLAAYARSRPDGPHVADLAWTRLQPWQELFARFFDQPAHAPFAEKIESLRVLQASTPNTAIGSEAALLVGWLATRLGIRSYRAGGALRYVRPDGGEVLIELCAVPHPPGVAPCALAEVSFVARSGDETLRGSAVRALASGGEHGETTDADVITWRLIPSEGAALEQRVRLGANKASKWLERTLRRPPLDVALLESIAFAENIADEFARVESAPPASTAR